MKNQIILFTHVTDGDAVYLTDNHNLADAKIIIRLDDGARLERCSQMDNVIQEGLYGKKSKKYPEQCYWDYSTHIRTPLNFQKK